MQINTTWLQQQKEKRLQQPIELSLYCQPLDSQTAFVDNDRCMPSASLIKIPIMIQAFRQAAKGSISFERVLPLHQIVDGGSFGEKKEGTPVTIRELVQHMIVESDNTCTNILIDLLGMDAINEEIARQGMKHTILQRKMMDFAAAKAGRENKTTASDMGHLLWQLANGNCLGNTLDTAMLQILSCQEDNCILPAQIPHPVRVDHKTGELDGLYHDCGIVWKDKIPYVCCLMADGITDEAQTISDLSYLARDIYDIM